MPEKELVIENEAQQRQAMVKFESKFLKDIRALIDNNRKQTLEWYWISLQRRKKKLLVEKLKRLRAMSAQQSQQGE
jgi:hypothetical protein